MLNRLIEKAKEYQTHKVDFTTTTHDIVFDPFDCGLVIPGAMGKTKVLMTNHCVGQVYKRLGPVALGGQRTLPKDYLDACPDTLRAINLNNWAAVADQKWLVRAYDNSARAVLSNRYEVVDTLECLEWTKEALESQTAHAYKFHNVHLTPDYLRLSITMSDITIPDGGKGRGAGGVYGIGCDIGTGEIGNAMIRCAPYVQRTSCTNSIVYNGGEAFLHRHSGSRNLLVSQFCDAVFAALKGCEEVLQRLVQSLRVPIPSVDDIISEMCKENGWSEGLGIAIAMGVEGENNLWGLVNGISYAANTLEDEEKRLEFHVLAGSLLMQGVPYQEV